MRYILHKAAMKRKSTVFRPEPPRPGLSEAEVTFLITAIVLFGLIVLAGYLFWEKTKVFSL
jgi:hypothetical protein